MNRCKLRKVSLCHPIVAAGVLNLLFLASFAQSQTTSAAAGELETQAAPTANSPQPGPAKAIGQLPPPEPAGEAAPIAPKRSPFPTRGLGLPISPLQERPAVNNDGEPEQAPGYFGAITDDRQKLPGVRIVEVVGGGPAELAGLHAGDLITSVNDQPVREMADLAKIFTSSQAGQQLKIVYQRGATLNTPGQEATLNVTLGERPPEQSRRYAQFGRIDEEAIPQNEGDRPSGMLLGVRAAPLDVAGQRRLGVPIQSGAMILEITPGSPAALAGIPRNAVIVSLNGLLVDSPDALTREILRAGPGAEVELGYYLGRNQIKRRIVLGGTQQADGAFGDPPVGDPAGNRLDDAAAARIGKLEQQVLELHRRLQLLEQQLQK